MGYKLNGADLGLDQPFKDANGTNYPANWLRLASDSEKAAVPNGGITWTADTLQEWDAVYYSAKDTPRPLAGLKTLFVNKQKEIANTLLQPTDWMVIRESEGGTAVPSDNKTYRAKVRTQCGLREATINACSSVAILEKTMKNDLAQTIDGTSSNGATEIKKTDGSSFDPKVWNDIPNPDLLEDWPTPI